MLSLLLVFLIFLWLLGYISLPLTNIVLFNIFGRSVTLNDLLIFLVIFWLVDLLPQPFREIATVLFLLWVLSAIGIITIAGFSNVILLAFIVGLIVYLFHRPILY